jgi:SAM-dependent methyltransferase
MLLHVSRSPSTRRLLSSGRLCCCWMSTPSTTTSRSGTTANTASGQPSLDADEPRPVWGTWSRNELAAEPERAKGDAFFELELEKWQGAVAAYDEGLGPVTRQCIPTLLDEARFLSPAGGGGADDLLDVATGPGYVLTAALAMRAAPGQAGQGLTTPEAVAAWRGSFVGLDFSSNMLDAAERRLAEGFYSTTGGGEGEGGGAAGIDAAGRIQLVRGDAQALPFPDGSFDCVTCNYGILHLGQPDAFLAEAHRVLRPGGRLAFSVWAAPPATAAFALILGSVGAAGNPDVPLPPGPPFFRFSDADEAARSLGAAGFEDARSVEVEQTWGLRAATEAAHKTGTGAAGGAGGGGGGKWDAGPASAALFDVFLRGTARTGALLAGQTPEEAAAVRREIEARLQAAVDEGRFQLSSGTGTTAAVLMPMPAVVSSGRKVR